MPRLNSLWQKQQSPGTGFLGFFAFCGLKLTPRARTGYRRHRTKRAYGCFLPDLTRFTALPVHRARPCSRRQLEYYTLT